MNASSQDNNDKLEIERFTTRGLAYAITGDMEVVLRGRDKSHWHRDLHPGEDGTVLVSLNVDEGDLSQVTVDMFHNPIEQMGQAIEVLTTARRKLAALLALGEEA